MPERCDLGRNSTLHPCGVPAGIGQTAKRGTWRAALQGATSVPCVPAAASLLRKAVAASRLRSGPARTRYRSRLPDRTLLTSMLKPRSRSVRARPWAFCSEAKLPSCTHQAPLAAAGVAAARADGAAVTGAGRGELAGAAGRTVAGWLPDSAGALSRAGGVVVAVVADGADGCDVADG